MKISNQPMFHNQAGSTAKSDDSKTTGQSQASVTKTAAGVGDARDSFERMGAIDTRGRIFGSAMGAPSASRPAIPEMKWVYGEGNPADMETDTPGKQPFDIEEAVQWTVSRDEMEQQLDEGTAQTTEEAREQIRVRDSMDALIRTMDEAEYSKAFNLRRDPTRGAGTPESAPTMIKVDKLGGGGGLTTGGRGGPLPGQGGTLQQPGPGGGGEAGAGTLTPGGVGFGGDTGGRVGARPSGGGGNPSTPPSTPTPQSTPPSTPQKGGEPHEPRFSSKDTSSSEGSSDSSDSSSGAQGGGGDAYIDTRGPNGHDIVVPEGEAPGQNSSLRLPANDPMTGHGGKGGNDARPRGLPEPARIHQWDRDLPAFATQTGADDKERPTTGGTSGRPAGGDLDDDIGGPAASSLRKGGGGEAGPLWKDLRTLNPIDPSKV